MLSGTYLPVNKLQWALRVTTVESCYVCSSERHNLSSGEKSEDDLLLAHCPNACKYLGVLSLTSDISDHYSQRTVL